MRYVLDTTTMDDAAIPHMGAPAFDRVLREICFGNMVAFNAMSYYESLRGIYMAAAPKNLEDILQYANARGVFELDLTGARIAARIYASARRQGERLTDSFSRDILIAAIAVKNNATVVTKNGRDFGRIQEVVKILIAEDPKDPDLKELRFESW